MERELDLRRRRVFFNLLAATIGSGLAYGCSSILPELPEGSNSLSKTTPTTEITPSPAVEETPAIIAPKSTTVPLTEEKVLLKSHLPSPTSSPTARPTAFPTLEATKETLPLLNPWEEETYRAVNKTREENGLPSLILSTPLIKIAQERSQDMATRNYFSHYNPKEPEKFMASDLLKQAGFPPGSCGEILFRTNLEQPEELADRAMEEFLNSPKHRRVLLGARYSQVGIGLSISENNFKILTIIFSIP